MSSYLLLVRDIWGGMPFDEAKVCQAIRQMDGICNCKGEPDIRLGDMVLECEFSFNDDATNIYALVSSAL